MLPWMTRRQMLCSLGNGFGALGLASVLAGEGLLGSTAQATSGASNPLAPKAPHFPPRARRVIFLFMNGGPSQVDTFDPKPALAKYAGQSQEGTTRQKAAGKLLPSPFTFQNYGQSGIEVSELYPHVARCIDDICVIRSMHTNTPNHEPSLLMMNSGETQPTRPSMGSWLSYGLGSENQNLPGYVVLCPGKPVVGPQLWSNSFLPGIYQGTHINNSRVDPKSVIEHVANRYVPQGVQRRQLDLLQQMNAVHLQERGRDDQLEARIASLEMAFRMQTEAQEAFDLTRETTATRQRYGEGQFANACLIARRLAERGVRMTQIYYGNGQPWDDHGDILNHRNHARQSDQPIAALLHDLKARGLLEETLVIWGGEFGRQPTAEYAMGTGRDHNAYGFTMWLAGGGIKGGVSVGETDEIGSAAVVNRLHVKNLHATALAQLGFDPNKLTYFYGGLDQKLVGVEGAEPIRQII
jgi:hypothetical protein